MATDAEHGLIIGGYFAATNRADTEEPMNVVGESRMPSGPITIIGNP